MQGITKLTAGDSLDFVTHVGSYPASDGWTLQYVLVPRFSTPAQAAISITAATFETSAYRVTEAPATTANWAAGVYSWASMVSKSGARVTLEQGGELTVAPNPATLAPGTDLRSTAAKALEAVRALLAGKASTGHMSYTIAGRELRSYSIAELIKLEGKLARDVNFERAAAGLEPWRGGINRVAVRAARV